MTEESKTDLYWCMVGDRVATHFLYKNSLSKFQFNLICEEVVKKVYGHE